ncbi:hypothetical protein I8920_01025 [Curtobacterium sp. YC1]|uniref:hypothetical protein n=1 Tax=Curtobacterium sp. YC1 TaxID=2795488 RepID=UPI0018E5A887|nr:hypothetical protein [Curtobacterium sp. YC1]QQD76392.1 hypothetical protein I8920_01025 [Curtobacterium sp. YC1]
MTRATRASTTRATRPTPTGRPRPATAPRTAARIVVVSAWASAGLVATGWALVGTAPMVVLLVATVAGGRRWRPVLPWAVALAASQATAIALWASHEDPPPSLTKDLDPVHAVVTIALAVGAAVAAHVTNRRARTRGRARTPGQR